MKKILLLLVISTSAAVAADYPFRVDFDLPSNADPAAEYVVEQQQSGGVWVEVAKGPTSPIRFTRNVPYGNFTARVYTRIAGVGRNVLRDTSPEATHSVAPGAPTNIKISYGLDGTATINVPTPSTVIITPSKSSKK